MPPLMHWATPPALPSVQARAHDLQGAEVLLAQIAADPLIANKAFDAHERVIDRLKRNGKSAVIPSKSNRKTKRPYDRELYKARHLIENFFCRLKQYRAIATRYDKTATNFLAAIHFASAVIWLN
jgi:transposase